MSRLFRISSFPCINETNRCKYLTTGCGKRHILFLPLQQAQRTFPDLSYFPPKEKENPLLFSHFESFYFC